MIFGFGIEVTGVPEDFLVDERLLMLSKEEDSTVVVVTPVPEL